MGSNGITAHSVAHDPHADETLAAAGRVFWFRLSREVEAVPAYARSAERDAYLRKVIKREDYGLLAGAMAIMVMKAVGWQYELSGGTRAARAFAAQTLDDRAEGGRGWQALLTKAAQDFYGQDKGATIEIFDMTYPGEAGGKRAPLRPPAVGLQHLDAAQVELTRSPEWPVVFHNPATGCAHILHRSRVIRLVDQENPDWHYAGLGFCAVSRVLQRARIIARQGTLEDERMADMPPPGIVEVNNARWSDIEEQHMLGQQQQGNTVFNDLLVAESIDPEHPVSVNFKRFASLPEAYAPMNEFTLAMLVFALAWGVDVRDFTSLSQGELGTAAEAEVKHSKARGMGTAYLRAMLAGEINRKVLAGLGVKFSWVEQDEEQELFRAEINRVKAQVLEIARRSGDMTTTEARRAYAEMGLLSELDLGEAPPDQEPGQEGARERQEPPSYTPETLDDPGPPATEDDAEVQAGDIRRVIEIWRSLPALAPYAPSDDYLPEIPGMSQDMRSLARRFFMRQVPPARIPPGSREGLYEIYISDMKRRSAELSGRLARGEIGLFAWKDEARALIKDAHVGAMAIGRGGWGEVTQADWGRVGAALSPASGGQYGFLDNFTTDILNKALAGETYSEAYLVNRLGMYMDSARQSFGNGEAAAAGINPSELPAMPGDGSTQCRSNCKCRWEFRETSIPGYADAYWVLGVADHCADCVERAAIWAPWGVVEVGDA